VKLDPETLLTVPTDPPAAGPDLALDPPPVPAPGPPGLPCPAAAEEDVEVADGDVLVVEPDEAEQAERPTTAHSTAAGAIHAVFLFSNDRDAFLAVGAAANESEEDDRGVEDALASREPVAS
jgi:hypothetical protein